MGEAWIVSPVRTAIGSFMGTLQETEAVMLGAEVIRATLERSGLPAEAVDEVLMGQVLQAGSGQGPARQAALNAGLPDKVPATTVNKVCGSGLKSVTLAAQAVRLGDADVIVAGGMENMSRAPYLLSGARKGLRMGDGHVIDSMLHEGLVCGIHHTHMGITAENVAERYGISREAQDAFALESQRRTKEAQEQGYFQNEIVPLTVRKGKETVRFDRDEHPRPDVTMERLAQLKPAFKEGGTVTAGNASGINDGAAAMLVVGDAALERYALKPFGRIIAYASTGVDPRYMGIGPVSAIQKALARAGLTLDKIDLIELNEAFAAQALAVIRELKLDPTRVNIHGGAIALGHPIGASGARILVTLLHALRRTGGRYGLASLCIGGGMGIALVVEHVEAS